VEYFGQQLDNFDVTRALSRLAEDVVKRTPEFAPIDMRQVLVTMTLARNGRAHGLQARVTPMRFARGSKVRSYRGKPYTIQSYVVDGNEILYLVSFCMPRFLNLPFDEKMITLLHELYHISPNFDGDLRRHAGRYSAHTHSKKEYDDHMAQLARAYLATNPDPRLHGFLRLNFAQLQHAHSIVVGIRVPQPVLIPVSSPSAY
jgi:predicted metallopeptidase